VVSFTPQFLYPPEKVPGTHWIGGYMGPRAGLHMVAKRKNPFLPLGESNPSSCSLVTTLTELYWLETYVKSTA